MQIPYQQLSAEALQGILEEFATRDGTEFTDLPVKLAQLRAQLESGRLQIFFDCDSGTCQLVGCA